MRSKLLFAILLIISLSAFAQDSTGKPESIAGYADSGIFKIFVNESQIATIDYTLEKNGHYKRDFTLTMGGQEVKSGLVINCDAAGLWQDMLITSPTTDITVKRKGAKSDYTIEKDQKTYSVNLTDNHILYDNYGPVFESILIKKYDMDKKGKQKFPRFLLPAKSVDTTLEYKGREVRKVKEKDMEFCRYDLDLLGILIQIWTDKDARIFMMNVPVQYAAFVREGYEDLLKYRIEDPLLSKPQYDVVKKKVMVPMRDGVKLATDLYFPKVKDKKFPVVFIRTPYKKEIQELDGNYYARRGYVAAIQDCRGRFGSEGVWEPFINEPEDGYDSIEWLGTQSWSTGKVGMIGASYVGWVQLWAAVEKPPHLATIIPNVAPPDPFYNIPYEYGSFFILGSAWWAEILESEATGDLSGKAMSKIGERKYERVLKKLPVIDLDKELFGKKNPYWRKWIKNNVNGGYWEPSNFMEKLKDLDIPVFLQSGWFDGDAIGTKLNYMELKKSKNKYIKMIVGPWGHTSQSSSRIGDWDFGKDAAMDLQSKYLKWFDYWLKGIDNKITEEPLVQVFSMFSNKWHKSNEYPLPETQFTKYYLSSGGNAHTANGDGGLVTEITTGGSPFDAYIYDPGDPTPAPFFYFKTQDQEKKEKEKTIETEKAKKEREAFHGKTADSRKDILIYRTESLTESVTIAGPVSAVLSASTSAVDTDWFVTLSDEDECGKIMVLGRGVIRARFRNSTKKPELLEKNKIYKYDIDVWHTGITFRTGHRIRIEIASALFPMFSRNLNTGGHNEMEKKYKKADQKIYHSKENPSYILLPVIK